MTKRVTIPKEELDIVNERGEVVGKRNIFLHFLNLVVEATPQKSDTETYLAHAIGQKIMVDGSAPKFLDFEEHELAFINGGIEKLRSSDKVVGKGWYYLLSALREAEPVPARQADKPKVK